jgi:hypothetical protein
VTRGRPLGTIAQRPVEPGFVCVGRWPHCQRWGHAPHPLAHCCALAGEMALQSEGGARETRRLCWVTTPRQACLNSFGRWQVGALQVPYPGTPAPPAHFFWRGSLSLLHAESRQGTAPSAARISYTYVESTVCMLVTVRAGFGGRCLLAAKVSISTLGDSSVSTLWLALPPRYCEPYCGEYPLRQHPHLSLYYSLMSAHGCCLGLRVVTRDGVSWPQYTASAENERL